MNSLLAGLVVLLFYVVSIPAQTVTNWTGGGSGKYWATAANWSNGVPNTTNGIAQFNTNTAKTPQIKANTSVGQIVFTSGSDAESFTGSNRTLTINGVSGIGIDNQGSLTQTFANKFALGSSQTWQTTANGGGLTFNSAINLNAYTLTLGLAASGTSTVTLGASVRGTGGLTANGAGTVIIAAYQAYTGPTTINSGATIRLGGADGLTDDNALTVNSGGTYDLNGTSDTLGTIAGAGSITLGSGTLTVSGDGSTTFSGTISGTGGLTKSTGTGTLTLSGASTYSGTTNINAGAIRIENATALGSSAGGTVVSTGEALEVANNITVSGEALTITGTGVSTGGALRNVSGANEWAGSITLSGASRINSDAGTLTISGGISGTRNLTLGGEGDITVSGIIGTGARTVTKDGTGTLTLSGANTYTGVTTVSAGTLIAANASALGTTAHTDTISSGATFGIQGGITLDSSQTLSIAGSGAAGRNGAIDNISGTNTIAGPITLAGSATVGAATDSQLTLSEAIGLGANTLTLGGATATGGIISSGAISGTGNILVAGGTNTLSNAANTYSGTTTINAGILKISADTNLGAVPGSVTSANITLGGGTLEATAGFTLAANRGITLTEATNSNITADTSQTLSYGGIIAGSGNLTFGTTSTGTGTVALSDASTYSGTSTIAAGTVRYDANNALPTATALTIASGATLNLNNYDAQIGSLSGSGTVDLTTASANKTLTVGDAASTAFSGVIQDSGSGAALNLAKQGTGTLTLSGTNSYSGTTSVAAGTLVAASNTALGTSAGATSVTSGATLALQGNITVTGEALTLNGSGAASAGALNNLSGNNTWAGDISLGSAATITSTAGQGTIGDGTSFANAVNLAGNTLTLNVGSGSSLYFNSQVGQTGGDTGAVTINGPTGGTVTYYGDQNTYTGTTTINSGTLIVDTSAYAQNGILGSVVIGDGSANAARLQMGQGATPAASDVISHTADFTINSNGTFDLNSQTETIGSLALSSGKVTDTGNAGTLYLGGDVTSSGTSSIDTFQLNLNAPTRTFTVNSGTLSVSSSLADVGVSPSAQLVKAGAGTLTLSGANSGYSGATSVNAGVLNIQSGNALGSSASGTTVASGAALQLQNNITVASEALTLNGTGIANDGALRSVSGNNIWGGNVTLGSSARINADAGTLALNGSVSGSGTTLTVGGAGNTTIAGTVGIGAGGLTKDGGGTLTLGAAGNNYTGATSVSAGKLLLGANDAMPHGTAVTVASGASFDLGSQTATIGSLAGAGSVLIGTGQLIAGDASNTTFSGTFAGTGTFTKQGSGQLTFGSDLNSGAGFAGGTLALNAGSLLFSASSGDSGAAANNFNLTISASSNPTLLLSGASIYLNNLTLTGTGTITIDFGGASLLSVLGNLDIGAGVSVTVTNWQDMTDYWYAQNWTGAVFDKGLPPMNQITFNPPAFVADDTRWLPWNREISPVPEPSTYGATLLGLLTLLAGWRRFRRRRQA
ncbi:MAG: autotransporter-associated beta strand repeat-containing protein [Opitutaceae bacterium]|nr:autotransporter-associated beta strand repeat-containing protein [Opitutaceae bacterium]